MGSQGSDGSSTEEIATFTAAESSRTFSEQVPAVGIPGAAGGAGGFHERLQTLFREVNALANQLRTLSAGSDRAEPAPGGGGRILEVLEQRGPHTVPQIARVHGSSRQNIQVLVDRLAAQGCVERTGNPAHKRSGLVHLTERGKRLLATLMEQERKSLEGLARYVPEGELEPAAVLLRQIRRLLAGEERESGFAGRGRTIPKRPRGRPRGSGRESRSLGAERKDASPAEHGRSPSAPSEVGPAVPVLKDSRPFAGMADAGDTPEGELPVNLL